MIQVTGEIIDYKYYRLLDYLFEKCDVLTFHIPNHYQRYITEKNIRYFPEHDLNTFQNENDCNKYLAYKANIEPYVKHFRNYFIKEYTDVEYAGGIYGNKMEIKVVKFEEYLLGALKATSGLYDWQFPNMPEDLCFYSQGTCFMQSIAHEKLCFIFSNDETTKSELKAIKLKFDIVSDVQAPELKN